MSGQQFTVVKDYGVNWWQIYWGSHYGYIAKSKTKTIKNVSYKNATKRVSSSKQTLVTATVAPVYDNTSGQLVQFANIEANQRIPVVKVMGNWFGVEINGRLGYIHNSKVSTVDTVNPSTPPAQNTSGKRYIQALEQAPLYDFRDKNRTHIIAELLKGQQLEITSYESENYYELRWGKAFLYVEKSKVQLISKKSYKNEAKDLNVKNRYFVPKASTTPIYDNSSGKLIPMANIKGNYRYPILSTYGNWIETSIGGRKGFIHKSKVMMDKGVPVLMYHHILQNHELGKYLNVSTTVTLNQFREQMGYLASRGYDTISVSDLERYMKGQITLPVHSVLITFDDGLLTTKIYAYEILKNYGFQATQFLISYRNEISHSNQTFNPYRLQFISREDMELMSDVYAYESHTYNLHDWVGNQSKVLLVSKQELIADLKKNLAALPHSKAFSYPFGKYNNQVISVLKSLGYTTAFTTKPGYNMPYDNVFEIKRLEANQKTTLNNFKRLVTPYE
ncbi:MAG: polysaccharide deacetylase family protein [Lysinibacillus sp.]